MCGIFGVYQNHNYSGTQFIQSLNRLQHRGHESCGISWVDASGIITKKNLGLIKDNYVGLEFNVVSPMFCGHVRYSTSGNSKNDDAKKIEEAQPLTGYHKRLGYFAVCHNGNIPMDTHDTQNIIDNIMSYESLNIEQILPIILEKYERSFNLLIMTDDAIYAVKDRYGTRPMCLGQVPARGQGQGCCVSSESCAMNDFSYTREMRSGEIVRLGCDGITTIYLSPNSKRAYCLFEYIYFLNGESNMNGMTIDMFRYSCGIEMAKIDSMKTTNKLKIDGLIVVGAPLTGIASGRGYADFFSLEYQQILEKKEGTTRTFILESTEKREAESKRKYTIEDTLDLEGKRILLTDDSLVRGITLKNIIMKFKNRKVKEIHIRIAAPPIYNRCQYGIDIPTKEELVANTVDITEMAAYLGCDSLEYIPLPTVSQLITKENILCTECFTPDPRLEF